MAKSKSLGRVFRKWKRLFSLKSFIAGESIAGLLIAFGALMVSALSFYQSRDANRAVERANSLSQESVRTSKEALDFAKQSEASKGELTLQVSISDKPPPIASITPVSPEFVISRTWVAYVHHGDEFQSAIADDAKPGVHDLSPIYERLSEMFKKFDAANTDSNGFDWGGGSLDEGYFPIVISVEYTYHGAYLYREFLYELYYDRLHSSVKKGLPEGYVALTKPRIVRTLRDDEDWQRVLMKQFKEWENSHHVSE
jgi:hypothetical protein